MIISFLSIFAILFYPQFVFTQCIRNDTYPNRLPYSIIPNSYGLNLSVTSPNEANTVLRNQFNGSIEINVTVATATTCLILHAGPEIVVQTSALTQNGAQLKPNNITRESANDFLIFNFDNALKIGTATLRLQFTGQINTQDGTGFFICPNTYNPTQAAKLDKKKLLSAWATSTPQHTSWKERHDSTEATEMMFATQFEESAARRAFPCWDEPSFKAFFQIGITVPTGQNLTVLSNTPVLTSTVGTNGVDTYLFERSYHVMASYIVAYAIGRLDYVEGFTNDGIRVRVYTPVGASQYGLYALNISILSLEFFANLWDFSYLSMNKKLDNIAVPGIVEDAMENWGLCTYDPALLFADPANLTRDNTQLPTQVVSHELSHQWFGDTVTCPYWTDLYLNEGFARLLEYIFTDNLYPEWYVWTTPEHSVFGDTSFYNEARNPSFLADATGEYPAVVVPQDETANSVMFYAKGASVNYMFYRYLGADLWNKVLTYHLKKYQYTNPNVYNLMDSFVTITGDPNIGNNFLTFLTQNNFPVVTLNLDTKTNVLTGTQEPIAYSTPSDRLWWVYVPIIASDPNSNQTYTTNLEFTTKSASVQLPPNVPWTVVGNANYTSFIAINYNTSSSWTTVLNQLSDTQFSEIDRELLIQSVYLLTNRKWPEEVVEEEIQEEIQ